MSKTPSQETTPRDPGNTVSNDTAPQSGEWSTTVPAFGKWWDGFAAHFERITSTKKPADDGTSQSTKVVRLSNDQAADWLDRLGPLLEDEGQQDDRLNLERFRQELEDAFWLARWLREDVYFGFCPTLLTNLAETLLRVSHADPRSKHVTTLEEIVETLSAS